MLNKVYLLPKVERGGVVTSLRVMLNKVYLLLEGTDYASNITFESNVKQGISLTQKII